MKAVSLDSALIAQIEVRIRDALRRLDAREQGLSSAPAFPSAEVREQLAKSRERLSTLQAHAGQVADKLSGLDASLASDERELRTFLGLAAELRQKLATWTGRAIG